MPFPLAPYRAKLISRFLGGNESLLFFDVHCITFDFSDWKTGLIIFPKPARTPIARWVCLRKFRLFWLISKCLWAIDKKKDPTDCSFENKRSVIFLLKLQMGNVILVTHEEQ
jgi:hypothetical protein